MLVKTRPLKKETPAMPKPGFYQQMVYKQLSKMTLGTLQMILPGGHNISFGNGEGALQAMIRVNDTDLFRKIVLYGDIGFGEAYVDGLWDTDNITDVIAWVLLNVENAPGVSGSSSQTFSLNVLRAFNKLLQNKRANTLSGSRKNISEHYDLNNDFFATFLDETMTYSSAIFNRDDISLEEAQVEKYDRLCRKLNLKHTDHVLEIGSGWGGNAIHMAQNYGCKVTSLTLSVEQQKFATQRITEAGLSERVKVLVKDYREVQGKFDKIVSIEMLEAVGHQYLKSYFRRCNDLLKKDGILAIQVIICPDSRYHSLRNGVDWIQKHIFPGSLLPSIGIINQAVNCTGDLTMIDMKEIGLHYAQTLKLWLDRFNENLDQVKNLGFDHEFIRKWTYYLCYCEAAFRMRNISVIQMVYSRPNNIGI
ncbi:SAM-dependent methyltransferase [Dyadobacter pollutisoli]|uniref:Cyclopropane-fatty-acyl-phospholipid synthase n=1 Tax=Dyadobacter pollutisoli TaxID=2910158 RepID=A0A9E8NCU1_9BACT|nr:cyclopropane-fatty-acyl-phospholipid synthase family protein [Dyadobacter pollutisoli]WAC14335.1 cyclopropane-fatty-acyl-phospholipid synthase [Dyadobacter pollutisoli]